MQIINPKNKNDKFTLSVPTSKSYSNRLLILGVINKGDFRIRNISTSTDVTNMISCLENVGIEFEKNGNDIIVKNSFPECEDTMSDLTYLSSGDGGTTNRFLIPVLARGLKTYRIAPSGDFCKRPIDHLVNPLKEIGVQVELSGEDYFIEIKGPVKMKEGKVAVDCSKSTQFLTGLQLAFSDQALSFYPENLSSSKKYYEMTEELIDKNHQGINDFIVPVDFSSLSYPASFAALNKGAVIENCHSIDLFQADSYLFNIFDEIGVHYEFKSDGLHIEAAKSLSPFNCDCSHCPDLTPTLAYMASFIDGESTLSHLEVLQYKESDRISWILEILKSFGVQYKFDEDSFELKIYGNSKHCHDEVEFQAPEDHRIIMVTSLFMKQLSGGSVSNFQHVKKSYSTFEDFIELI